MDLDKLSTADKIIAGTGLVLVIDLLFLPWHSVDTPFGSFSITAIEEENAFLGVVALLLAAAVTAVTLVRVFKPDVKLPELPVSYDEATFYAAAATAGVLVLKLLLETNFLGFGAYLGILLAGGLAYGGYQKRSGDAGATAA